MISPLRYLSLLGLCCSLLPAEGAPAPSAPKKDSLVLGGGCFWCLEAAFELVPGVLSVESGYAGGATSNPTYKEVCGGATGHAEVVRIAFDPQKVSLDRLFELFWKIHDPTTLNRQGNDVGTQYRSVIFAQDQQQAQAARVAIQTAQSHFSDPIVTEVAPLDTFWRAEEYHQDYYEKNPSQGYCRYVVKPKVEKMQHELKSAH